MTNIVGNGNHARDVNIQDQTTEIIDLHLTRFLDDLTLLAPLSVDDTSASIETTGVVPAIDDTVCLKDKDGVAFYQGNIVAVSPIAGNQYTVTLDTPLDAPFSVLDGCSLRSDDLAVSGALGSPVEFTVSPFGLAAGTEWDITRIIINIFGTLTMDDGLFGDQPALTNGVIIRTDDGVTKNIFNAKTNGDFAAHAFDVVYAPKAPAGQTAFRVRRTFGGQDKNGVVARLKTDESDGFKILVQDDITGLVRMTAIAQGHIVDKPR